MKGSKDPLFPVTLWPPTPLPPLPVERQSLAVADGRLKWLGPHPEGASRPLPAEWVLRRLDKRLDLDTDRVIAELLDDGVLARPYFDRARVPQERHHLLAPLPSIHEYRADWWTTRTDGTLEDARWWLKTARALARAWADAANGVKTSAWRDEGFVAVKPEHLWAQFVTALNAGTASYVARVAYRLPSGLTAGMATVDLYSECCRQIFNLLVAEERPRTCQSETCGRTFVHQQGGAAHGQHRTRGLLMYCTPECAHAQANREYRRRKAAEKENR